VRDRILKAGRTLFAQNGYDNATTSAIARAAGSSESQLVKHFGGKQGLLVAIFDDGWNGISRRLDAALAQATTPAEKIGLLAHTVLEGLEHDSELKLLFLIEGRRVRGHGTDFAIGNGFLQLVRRADEVLAELQAAGQLRPELHPQAVRSGLVGMMEGLLRDHYMAQKTGYPAAYSLEDLPRMLSLVVQSLLGGEILLTAESSPSPTDSPHHRSSPRPAAVPPRPSPVR
jgi:AcrR family transcriptional regulator